MTSLQKKLQDSIELKEKYVVALEAVHADLKDSEAENDQIRQQYQALRNQSRNSPRKPQIQQSDDHQGYPDPISPEKNENRAAVIRYLLMENSRLRALEYSAIGQELFHPSDPLTKRVLRNQKPQEEGDQVDKKSKQTVMGLIKEWVTFGSQPLVVDLTHTLKNNEPAWKSLSFDPMFQITSHRKKMKDLISRTQDACNNFSRVENQGLSLGKYLPIGQIKIPSENCISLESSLVKLHSKAQLDSLHQLFAF